MDAQAQSRMKALTLNAHQAQIALVADTFEPFDPRAYLKEYYSHLGYENQELLRFLDEAYKTIFAELDTARVLEFGGGPTIYQLISAARYPVSIDFSDYLDTNLKEVQTWLQDKPEQFVWDDFVRYVLSREGISAHLCGIEQRKRLLRDKIQRFIHCNAKATDPLISNVQAPYDIVSVHFVLESITTEMTEWDQLVDNIVPLVRSQGYIVMCSILDAQRYRVGEHYFPAVPISPETLETKLKQKGFSIIRMRSIEAEHREVQGYNGICMMLARKDDA